MTAEPTASHLARLTALFHSSRMSKIFGMTMHYDAEGRAVVDWPYDERFEHP